jgi:CPA2 family monovalent cation:H+ antiporter-2/trk system potassium uptake protein TrkA
VNQHVDFTPLLVVSILAVVVPVILHRIKVIRIPIIVGEIIGGILVGPAALGFIGGEPNAWLDFLRLFGLPTWPGGGPGRPGPAAAGGARRLAA